MKENYYCQSEFHGAEMHICVDPESRAGDNCESHLSKFSADFFRDVFSVAGAVALEDYYNSLGEGLQILFID